MDDKVVELEKYRKKRAPLLPPIPRPSLSTRISKSSTVWWLASLLSFCVAYIGRDLALIAMYAPVFGVIFAIVALRNGVLFVMRYLQLRETEELDLLVWCIWAVMLVCVTALLYLFGLHFASIVCAVILGGVALECVRKWWEWYVESLAFIPESENDPYDVPPAA